MLRRRFSRFVTIVQVAVVAFSLMAFIDLRHTVDQENAKLQRFNQFVVGDCNFQNQRTAHSEEFLLAQAKEYALMANSVGSPEYRRHYNYLARLFADRVFKLAHDPYLYGCGATPVVPSDSGTGILNQ